MLGALIALTQLVKIDSVMKVLQSRIPPGFLDVNKQAFELGLHLAEPFKK
jgi:2-oxoglutarate ferredoxin oxidoreductase subunit gamma